jgi:phosphoenolpyruvate-protein phosphotransferase
MLVTRAVLSGRIGSPGVGVGRILRVELSVEAPEIAAPAGAPDTERARLSAALEAAAEELEALARQLAQRAGDETAAIFEAQAVFARDPGIVDPAMRAIDGGLSAIDAILASTDDQAAILAAVDDEYFQARAADVRDVGRRVAGIISGVSRPDLWHVDGQPAVIVADDLDPSAVATLRPELVAGIALAGGAPTGHASIVARGLGIALVLGLGASVADAAEGAVALVDAGDPPNGRLVIEPDASDLAALEAAPTRSNRPTGSALGSAPAWPDGDVTMMVSANVGSVVEADAALAAGASGIGLVRTELLFLGRRTPPSVAEQRNVYARIRERMGARPVVFRTLDVGGDKPAAWQSDGIEANPALGVRGVRLGLARPELLDDQLRALVDAAAGAEVRIMLPMVATVEEVVAVRARLDAIVDAAVAPPSAVLLGVMIEVPAAALVADGLAEVADFFSIGTNDLVQYTLAADRVNPALAELATALQPAVLRLIAAVVDSARAHGRHVAVCGEAAADLEMVPLLVGLGVDELSVAPSSVAAVTAHLAGLRMAACRDLAVNAIAATTVAQVRERLRAASLGTVPPV